MQKLFALIDRLTEKMPPNVLRMIRLGALLLWVVLGTVIVFFSWRSGQDSTPPQGQDLSIATIRERVQKEENRRRSGDVTVPDLKEFFPETNSPDLPTQTKKQTKPGLSGVDDRLIEPQNPIEQPSALPPFLGEDSRTDAPLRLPDTRDRAEERRRERQVEREHEPDSRKGERTERKVERTNDKGTEEKRERPGKPDMIPVEP